MLHYFIKNIHNTFSTKLNVHHLDHNVNSRYITYKCTKYTTKQQRSLQKKLVQHKCKPATKVMLVKYKSKMLPPSSSSFIVCSLPESHLNYKIVTLAPLSRRSARKKVNKIDVHQKMCVLIAVQNKRK